MPFYRLSSSRSPRFTFELAIASTAATGSFADDDVLNRGVKQWRLAAFERVPTATATILTEAF